MVPRLSVVDHIGEAVHQHDFVSKLHAACRQDAAPAAPAGQAAAKSNQAAHNSSGQPNGVQTTTI